MLIQLTNPRGYRFYINVAHIESIVEDTDGITEITMVSGRKHKCRETPEKIDSTLVMHPAKRPYDQV